MTDTTVLIVTRNRREELRRALTSVAAQGVAAETIVVDDGSEDGTAAMVEREFPTVRLHRTTEPLGCVVQRNRGVARATGSIVVMLDDDAVFGSPDTLEQTLRDFDHARVGAVAIPHVDVGILASPRLQPPSRDGVYVTSEFAGGASAIRRVAFEEAGGYRELLFRQGEERDLCVRLLARGWIVRVGRAEPILHYPSPVRDLAAMDLYGRRNTILYAWFNEPFPGVAARMVEMTVQGIVSGLRVRRPLAAVHGLAVGYRACWQERRERRPLPAPVIRLFRRLWKQGPLPLEAIAPALPAPPAPRPALAVAPARPS